MLLRLFKGYQAILLLIIPMVGILLWFDSFFNHGFEMHGQYVFMPLSNVFLHLFGYNTILSKLIAFGLMIINGLLLVRLNISYNFLRARTYLPAIIYIFLLTFVEITERLTPALMASVFVILALDKVMSTFKKEKLAIQIMDASIFISLAGMFYFPALFLIVFLWIGLILLRPFRWREWVFTILGLIVPFIIMGSFFYIMGKEINIPIKKLLNIPYIHYWNIRDNILSVSFFVFNSLLIILASLQIMQLFGTKKTHSRRYFIYFLWLFILSTLLYFLVPSTSIEIISIGAIPLSFLFSHYFLNLRSKAFAEIIFLFFLLFIVLNKFI